jgi:hypothetical protein
METNLQQPDNQPPALWNPNAAAAWAVLFTPAFGAYLHASNWRTLGKPERAAANMIWVWGTLALMAVALGTLFLPDSEFVDAATRYAGLGAFVGWYTVEARVQAKYVKELLPRGYAKKRWGAALALGFAFVAGYLVVGVMVLVALEMYRGE